MMLQPLPVSEDPHKQDPNLRRPHCPNIVKTLTKLRWQVWRRARQHKQNHIGMCKNCNKADSYCEFYGNFLFISSARSREKRKTFAKVSLFIFTCGFSLSTLSFRWCYCSWIFFTSIDINQSTICCMTSDASIQSVARSAAALSCSKCNKTVSIKPGALAPSRPRNVAMWERLYIIIT